MNMGYRRETSRRASDLWHLKKQEAGKGPGGTWGLGGMALTALHQTVSVRRSNYIGLCGPVE